MKTTNKSKLVRILEKAIIRFVPNAYLYREFIDFYTIADFVLIEIKKAEHRYSQTKC